MSKKPLPDLDLNHPFYSDKGIKLWKQRIAECEKEEKELVKENRKRYRERNRPTKDPDEKEDENLRGEPKGGNHIGGGDEEG